MGLLEDFKQFVADVQSGNQWANWSQDNCGKKSGGTVINPTPTSELGRWYAFRDAILAGSRPSPPLMTTARGKELIDAGVIYLDATKILYKLSVTLTSKSPKVGSQLLATIAVSNA